MSCMSGGAGREVQLGAYWRARQRHCRAGARGSLQGFGRGLASPNPHRPASRPRAPTALLKFFFPAAFNVARMHVCIASSVSRLWYSSRKWWGGSFQESRRESGRCGKHARHAGSPWTNCVRSCQLREELVIDTRNVKAIKAQSTSNPFNDDSSTMAFTNS